jgi:hypothetical protein
MRWSLSWNHANVHFDRKIALESTGPRPVIKT